MRQGNAHNWRWGLAATLGLLASGCGWGSANVPAISQASNSAWSGFSATAATAALGEADDNHNGKLNSGEAGLSTDEFATADTNHDGQVSITEAIAFTDRLVSAVREQAESSPADQADGPTPPPMPHFLQFSGAAARNQTQLFVDASAIYPAMLASIRSAQRTVQVDYFLLGGEVGHQFADALIERARAGVDVCVMLDGFAPNGGGPTGKEIAEVLAQLQKAGIQQRFYPLAWLPHNPGHFANHFLIDHDKLLVTDHQTAFVGSMNLFDLAVMNHDLMIRLDGPMAQELSAMMDTEWQRPHASEAPIVVPEGPDTSLVRGTKTDASQQTTKTTLLEDMSRAQKSVYTAIYDFSDLDVANGLIAAYQRGLDVRVMVDRHESNDKYFPLLRYFNIYGIPNLSPVTRLLAAQVPVKWFDPISPAQELHMKMTIFDGRRAMLGSTNYTYQAFNNFRETGIELDGGLAVDQVTQMFVADWQNHASAPHRPTFKDRLLARLSAFMENQHLGWW